MFHLVVLLLRLELEKVNSKRVQKMQKKKNLTVEPNSEENTLTTQPLNHLSVILKNTNALYILAYFRHNPPHLIVPEDTNWQ